MILMAMLVRHDINNKTIYPTSTKVVARGMQGVSQIANSSSPTINSDPGTCASVDLLCSQSAPEID